MKKLMLILFLFSLNTPVFAKKCDFKKIIAYDNDRFIIRHQGKTKYFLRSQLDKKSDNFLKASVGKIIKDCKKKSI